MDDVWEFLTSWTFMFILVGLLCLLVVAVLVALIVIILFLIKRKDKQP